MRFVLALALLLAGCASVDTNPCDDVQPDGGRWPTYDPACYDGGLEVHDAQ